MQIEGAAALVTGGASGLGEATVRTLTEAGATVTIVDRDEAKGKALAAELGGGTRFAVADVADRKLLTPVSVATIEPPRACFSSRSCPG